MRTRNIPTLRLLAGMAFLAFAAWERSLLFLIPAAFLFYQYYRAASCVVCEAGFCEDGAPGDGD